VPTRLYIQSTGSIASPTNPAFDAGWEQTGSVVRRPMVKKGKALTNTALTDSAAITIPITTTQQICAWQGTSDEIFKPVRIGADCLFSMVIRCSENATTNNAFLAYSLRAFSPDGGTLLGTIASSLANTGTEFAVTASAATRIFGNGTTTVTCTANTFTVPFRLVLDVGCHAQAPSAAGSFIQRVGFATGTADFALTSALTTNLNPWMELSYNLNTTGMNNYQFFGSSGLSVTEKIR
jgi:hypothetical protein